MVNKDLFSKATAAAIAEIAKSPTPHAPHAERVAEHEAAVRAVGVAAVKEMVPKKRGQK
ncbi:MAG TPA: hypothetical protein VGY54_16605 [Polyangiaceae bacterium]|jgi:hypothetical protein|nr:hypothetical protein [Polyangiaceae bacterium]